MQQFRLGTDRPGSTLRQERGSLDNKKLDVCQQWGYAVVSADCSALAKSIASGFMGWTIPF